MLSQNLVLNKTVKYFARIYFLLAVLTHFLYHIHICRNVDHHARVFETLIFLRFDKHPPEIIVNKENNFQKEYKCKSIEINARKLDLIHYILS